MRKLVLAAEVSKLDRKSTRLNSSHSQNSYAVFCLKKNEVHLLLVDEARHLVDRDVDLRLRVGEHGVDPVALDAAFLVEQVDRRLGAELRRLRAAAGERAGDVVDEADLDFLLLRRGRTGERKRQYRGHRVAKLHGTPPLSRSLADVSRCYTGRLQEKAMPTSIRYLPVLLALAALPLSAQTVRVYVTNSAGDSIHVIDPATNKAVQAINGVEGAHGIDFSPDGQRVYVSNEADSTLDVIDRASGKMIAKVRLSDHPNNISATKDGGREAVGIAEDPGALDLIYSRALKLSRPIAAYGRQHN